MAVIDGEIEKLLRKNVICSCSYEQRDCIFNVFVRPKKNGTCRMNLNSIKLNKFIEMHHFKTEVQSAAVSLMIPEYFRASIKYKAVYFSIHITPECQNFFKFDWKGQLYKIPTSIFLQSDTQDINSRCGYCDWPHGG